MAGLYGLDVDRFLNERNPTRKAITLAVIEKADGLRSNHMKEQAGRIVSLISKMFGGKKGR